MKVAIATIAGLVIGAVAGFLLVLIPIGVMTGSGQSGLAAIFFGVPLGAIAGAIIGAKKAGATTDDVLGLPKE